ncbi:MAG TPA: putative ATP-grasp-modified RiPP [Pseudonocardiaceae bacterium]|jgi:putative ATP-grasp target RiPP|nr:putative ATP-grasp-modified RiPP [Pseudonocardiaceae bacterium]
MTSVEWSNGENSVWGHEIFPWSDHFPLGRLFGQVDSKPQQATAYRPFGLTLAAEPREGSVLRLTDLSYDEERQIGLVMDRGQLVPLAKHTDGTTNTITDGGDGQGSNKDSDTDHRED